MTTLINGIRSILFNIIFYPFTVLYCGGVLMPLCLAKTDYAVRRGILGYCLSSLWIARFTLGLKYEYRGAEKLPKEGAFILAAAHQSNMDPILTFPLRNDVTALAKKQLFKVPFIGTALRKAKIVRIDRESRTAHKGMEDVAKHIQELGRPLIVYPQATRVRPGHYKRLKSGAYYLQADTSLPVYTVSTNTGLFWTKGFWHRGGTAVYEINGPLPHGLDKTEFMEAIDKAVVRRSDELMLEAGYGYLLEQRVDDDA
ncbi:lysophospholipid acyltransferase family protein [Kordiimonas aestuarii]|uniref:lysophospholipid acyltransferase family protein n=1 Tax=Kordiimonas aestuarii TaxID=1005925 RepID=UPI0021CF725B|nr:1-acyl-sn-glycerol-3-phosphate acyltransferase [Kordiimonas aestuarii]